MEFILMKFGVLHFEMLTFIIAIPYAWSDGN